MKTKLLLPYGCRFVGIILLLISGLLFYLWSAYNFSIPWLVYDKQPAGSIAALFEDGDYTNEFIFAGLMLSLIFLAFSRGRVEDERSTLPRLQSLHISHYVNYLVIAVWIFFTKGLGFLAVAVALPYAFLVCFLLIYYIRMYVRPLFS